MERRELMNLYAFLKSLGYSDEEIWYIIYVIQTM